MSNCTVDEVYDASQEYCTAFLSMEIKDDNIYLQGGKYPDTVELKSTQLRNQVKFHFFLTKVVQIQHHQQNIY
jgi:hypothetical protein